MKFVCVTLVGIFYSTVNEMVPLLWQLELCSAPRAQATRSWGKLTGCCDCTPSGHRQLSCCCACYSYARSRCRADDSCYPGFVSFFVIFFVSSSPYNSPSAFKFHSLASCSTIPTPTASTSFSLATARHHGPKDATLPPQRLPRILVVP